MNDDEIFEVARRVRMPRYMYDTPSARQAIQRFVEVARKSTPPEAAPRINTVPLMKRLKDQRDECADVLRELVTLKDMKDGFGEEPFGEHNNDAARRDYERRKPLAWKRAHEAIAKVPSYVQQLRNVAAGIGMTYEDLIDALNSSPMNLGEDSK